MQHAILYGLLLPSHRKLRCSVLLHDSPLFLERFQDTLLRAPHVIGPRATGGHVGCLETLGNNDRKKEDWL